MPKRFLIAACLFLAAIPSADAETVLRASISQEGSSFSMDELTASFTAPLTDVEVADKTVAGTGTLFLACNDRGVQAMSIDLPGLENVWPASQGTIRDFGTVTGPLRLINKRYLQLVSKVETDGHRSISVKMDGNMPALARALYANDILWVQADGNGDVDRIHVSLIPPITKEFSQNMATFTRACELFQRMSELPY